MMILFSLKVLSYQLVSFTPVNHQSSCHARSAVVHADTKRNPICLEIYYVLGDTEPRAQSQAACHMHHLQIHRHVHLQHLQRDN